MPLVIPLPNDQTTTTELLDYGSTDTCATHDNVMLQHSPRTTYGIPSLAKEDDQTSFIKTFDPTLRDVRLPASLENRDDGAIGITGHRVKLIAILELLRSAERPPHISQLHEAFPTVSIEKLAEVMWFCAVHKTVVDRYYEYQRVIAEEIERTHGCEAPSLDDLCTEWTAKISKIP